MTAINDANRLYRGASVISNAYVGTTMVWPRISAAFAVFDVATSAAVLITGGGLSVKNTGSGTTPSGARVANASAKTSGKFYYEFIFVSQVIAGGSVGLGGIGTTSSNFASMQNNGTTGITVHSSGQIWTNGGIAGSISSSISVGTRVAVAVDLDNYRFWARILPSGLWNSSGTANPATNVNGYVIPAGTMVPFVTFGGASTSQGNIVKTNFGHYTFGGAVPSGFTAGWTV